MVAFRRALLVISQFYVAWKSFKHYSLIVFLVTCTFIPFILVLKVEVNQSQLHWFKKLQENKIGK